MKSKGVTLIMIAGLILSSGVLTAQEKFSPEFRYLTGKTYRYSNLSTFNTTQEMGGQEMKMTGNNKSILKMVVDSVTSAGHITFVNSFEEMRSEIKSAMMDTVLDMKDVIGKRGKVTIDRYGNEISSKVVDTINSRMTMASGYTSMLYGAGFVHFPDHPVVVGEKWNKDVNDTTDIGDGEIVSQGLTEYTLAGMEQKNGHNCLKISFTSKSEMTGKMKQMGMDFFIEGTNDVSGTVWFDLKLGIMVDKVSKSTQDMTYAMTGQMKMTVPMNQIVETSSTLIE